METLLNCLWLVLSLSLVTAWLTHVRSRGAEPCRLLPSRRMQFTAIVVLVLLLFPVISLTDDLVTAAAARDTEQALRLHDLCDGSYPPPAMLSSALAWMDSVHSLLRSGPRPPVEQEAGMLALDTGERLPVESRPPPVRL